jgi:hypothetical protein
MANIKEKIVNNKGLITIISIILPLLILSIALPSRMDAVKKNDVLGLASKTDSQNFNSLNTSTALVIFSPTETPGPTITPVLSQTPTLALTPTSVPTTTQTPTPTPVQVTSVPTQTPTLAPAPTDSPTPTQAPAPAGLNIKIGIDYAGQKASDSYTTTVNQGQTAWDAVIAAVGKDNLQYADYGGNMGIFITGFNTINAASNQYFEFRVNGVSSTLGVSGYQCVNGDKLDFVLTSF